MRKWLVNLTGLLTISSSALPLIGCTFNFYVNRVTERVATNLAIQTSSVIKSLIASKELSADTKSTIGDALSIAGDSIINNQSEGSTKIDNWDDFKNSWGFNKNINTKGFNGNEFIVRPGAGSLTSQVNSLRTTNTTLGYLTYVNALSVIDNNALYGILLGNKAIGKPIIKSFLTELKNQMLPEPFGSLINSLVNDYKGNFLTPITTLLTELVAGWTDVTDPNNLKTYIEGWQEDNVPYSQWVDSNGKWTLGANYYQEWSANDINLYHGGTYINYLFKKIGIDNPDKLPLPSNGEFKPQYLGEILGANIVDGDPLAALEPYLNLLLTNPKYLFLLITGIIPVIKQLVFEADDLIKGIKNLTFGNHYPTDKPNNSYNLKTVFAHLKDLIEDTEIVERWEHKDKIYEWTKLQKIFNDKILSSAFLYDVKVLIGPLPILLNGALGNDTRFSLVDTVGNFLTDASFKQTFNDIYNVIEKMNDQFQGSDGINLNLENLKNLLLNENNGLLVLLEEVATTIADIIKPKQYADDDDITDEQLGKLYQSIGGQLPEADGIAPSPFKDNSLIQILKDALTDKDSDLNVLIKVLIRDDQYQGVANLITKQNETWIKENYTNYLQPNYLKSNVTHIEYKISETSTEKITEISYDFYYQVNGVTYLFFIKGVAVDNKDTFLGIHNFKFTDIYNLV